MTATVTQKYTNAGTGNISQSVTTDAGTNVALIALVSMQTDTPTAGRDVISDMTFDGNPFYLVKQVDAGANSNQGTSVWMCPNVDDITGDFILNRVATGSYIVVVLLQVTELDARKPVDVLSSQQLLNSATPPDGDVTYTQDVFIINNSVLTGFDSSAITALANAGWTIGNSGTFVYSGGAGVGGIYYTYRTYTGSGTSTGGEVTGSFNSASDWNTLTVAFKTLSTPLSGGTLIYPPDWKNMKASKRRYRP